LPARAGLAGQKSLAAEELQAQKCVAESVPRWLCFTYINYKADLVPEYF